MKLKLFVAAVAVLGMTSLVHAEDATALVPKDKMIGELQAACVKSGNTEQSCICSMEKFQSAMTSDEWDLLFAPAKKITQEDLPKFKVIEDKITTAAKTCGADKI